VPIGHGIFLWGEFCGFEFVLFNPFKRRSEMRNVILIGVTILVGAALVGCGGGINKEAAKKVYMGAVDKWAKEYEKAEDKTKVKGFDKYLDEEAKAAGAKDWADYATKAATDMGATEWSKCVQEFTKAQQDKMKELTDAMQKKAEGDAKKAAEGEEEKKEEGK
jgi:hypothetical protein